MEALAVVSRGKYIESVHYGLICIVDQMGKVLYQLGDCNTSIFFRSSAKPIQVLPLIQSGAASALNYSLKEVAIACASHSGQRSHQETVEGILTRLGLTKTDLHCGTMDPYNEAESTRLKSEGLSPTVLHCSCSGKHAAMLGLAKYMGFSLDDYQLLTNPVQQIILKTISHFIDEEPERIPTATDGCGVPIYLLPIKKIAMSYARLAAWSNDRSSPYHSACATIFDAMTQYPEMVAGEGEFCTELMQATGGRLIGKVGGEAVYCLALRQSSLGICIKIADGNERAVYPVVIHLLKQLDTLDENDLAKLKTWESFVLKNNLHQLTGSIDAVFSLKKPGQGLEFLGKKLDNIKFNPE